MNVNEIINKIEQAFADVNYPGDDDLLSLPYTGKQTAYDLVEQNALVREFRGKTDWRQLDAEFLCQAPEGWGTALSFFSVDAQRFYIPAYMIADIRGDLEDADIDICPAISLCSGLTSLGAKQKIAKRWGGGTVGESARRKFSSYDAKQVSAVVAYLWWKLESRAGFDPTIEEALLNYWMERDAGG